MQPEVLKQSLNAIKEYVLGIHELKETNEIRLMRLQLRMIDRSIRQFEKAGIQVPEGVTSDRDGLEAKLKEIKSGPQGLVNVYDELIEILIQMGGVLARRPDRDIYRKMKEQRKKEISSEILRESIIAVLRETGGTGREREVLSALGVTLKAQFSSSDLERPNGKMTRWEMKARKERKRMIEDGLLTPDSIHSRWKLR